MELCHCDRRVLVLVPGISCRRTTLHFPTDEDDIRTVALKLFFEKLRIYVLYKYVRTDIETIFCVTVSLSTNSSAV